MRPQGSNIVYTVAKVVSILETLIRQNKLLDQRHPDITICVIIKEKMVPKKLILVKICRLL